MPEIFKYDPSDGYLVTVYKGILDSKHTVLPAVMGRAGFWFFLVLHLVIYFLHLSGILKGMDDPDNLFAVSWDDVKIITAITTFFNVFYSNQCFHRYLHFYDETKSLMRAVHEFIFEFRLHVRHEIDEFKDLVESSTPSLSSSPEKVDQTPISGRKRASLPASMPNLAVVEREKKSYLRIVTRYLIALLLLFFFDQRSETCSRLRSKDDDIYLAGHAGDNEWKKLTDCGLLKDNEVAFLRSEENNYSTRQRCLILLHWCAQVSRLAYRKALDRKEAPNNALKCMVDALHNIRRHLAEVQDTSMLPVPYPYFHLLSMMLVINLFLWAYCMGLRDSIFSPFVFFFAALIFMGMMELASQLSAPFGDDDVDFPLETWLADVSLDAFVLGEYQFLDASGLRETVETERPFEHQGRQPMEAIVRNFLDPEAPLLNLSSAREGPRSPWLKRDRREANASPGAKADYSPQAQGRVCSRGESSHQSSDEDTRQRVRRQLPHLNRSGPRPVMKFLCGGDPPDQEREYVPMTEVNDDDVRQIPTCSIICAVETPG